MVQAFIEGISAFMRDNQSWAAPIAFLVAFGESLCFASIVWPGWAILVGFSGALAASGVPPSVLMPMVIAAGLGGAAGYALSYWIGLYFKDSIPNIWPFKSQPDLIPHGQNFFNRWGAWSIFFGHFVGPVRAVIPVVAGMFRMRQLPFQIANTTSAFIWAAWAVLAPYWSIFYRDAIFSAVTDNWEWVAGGLFVAAYLNSLPMPLMAVPTLMAFVGLGALFIYAGGDPLTAAAAGIAGAWLGDLAAYSTGKRSDTELHTIWPNSWSPESGVQALAFFRKWGITGILPSKFMTTKRSFVPLAAGAERASYLPYVIVTLFSAVLWTALLLAPVPLYMLWKG